VVFSFNDLQRVVRTPRPRTLLVRPSVWGAYDRLAALAGKRQRGFPAGVYLRGWLMASESSIVGLP
jgi:hypothetical protein